MIEFTQDQRPDLQSVVQPEKPKELGLIPAWSYSALKTYEACAYRSYITKVKRVQEDWGPAAKRGTRIHKQAEEYVASTMPELPHTLEKFKSEFKSLREQFKEDKVEIEGEWGFTIDWHPCEWMAKDVWVRMKLDALVNESNTSVRVIDYKTGKRFGNEITHSQQALIYAIGTFFRYPKLQHAQTEIWYLDHGEVSTQAYTRDEAMIFMPALHQRAVTMTTALKFPPNPSKVNCRWCSFKEGENPPCQWGVK